MENILPVNIWISWPWNLSFVLRIIGNVLNSDSVPLPSHLVSGEGIILAQPGQFHQMSQIPSLEQMRNTRQNPQIIQSNDSFLLSHQVRYRRKLWTSVYVIQCYYNNFFLLEIVCTVESYFLIYWTEVRVALKSPRSGEISGSLLYCQMIITLPRVVSLNWQSEKEMSGEGRNISDVYLY